MADNSFVCRDCGESFTVKAEALARYPGWTPRQCWPCKTGKKAGGGKKATSGAGKAQPKKAAAARRSVKRTRTMEENLTTAQVLERYTEGPDSGVFTDGACTGNPGPGGWGMVWVRNGEIVAEDCGHDAQTTNNRMEMRALIAAYEHLPEDAEVTIFSDSNLCVRTLNEWARGWQKRGWRRKTGPVENLDLVKRGYELAQRHPRVTLKWIKAHAGSRWNEYADSLATAYTREAK